MATAVPAAGAVFSRDIAELCPPGFPTGATSAAGFASVLCMGLDADPSNGITCVVKYCGEDDDCDIKDAFLIQLCVSIGEGVLAVSHRVTLTVPLLQRATPEQRHAQQLLLQRKRWAPVLVILLQLLRFDASYTNLRYCSALPSF